MSTPTTPQPPVMDIAALVAALKPMIASEISSAIGPVIAAEISSAIAAAVPSAPTPASALVPPASIGPSQPQANITPPFIGPLTTNQAAGASSNLLMSFPEVDEAVIIAVISHQFRGSDLYKLDSKYRDKADRATLEIENGAVRVKTDSSVKDYPTPSSVELPLLVYFRIIIAHCAPSGDAATITLYVLSYIESFLRIRTEYEWSAVLGYHMAFFRRRRREMAHGDYSGWRKTDPELHTDHLAGFRKAPRTANTSAQSKRNGESNARTTEVCRMFNLGSCTSPCRNGRIHKCTNCNKADHGASTCSQAART